MKTKPGYALEGVENNTDAEFDLTTDRPRMQEQENRKANAVAMKSQNHAMPGYITVTDSEQSNEKVEGAQEIPGHVTLADSERQIGDDVYIK